MSFQLSKLVHASPSRSGKTTQVQSLMSEGYVSTVVNHSAMEVNKMAEQEVPSLVKIAKAFLWLASWGISIWWISLWYRLSSVEGKAFKNDIADVVRSSFWGPYATNYMMYVVPVVGLAILALLYLELEARYPTRVRCSSREQSRLVRLYRAVWTHPLLVKTPIGIITLIDIVVIVIVLTSAAIIWAGLQKKQMAKINAAEPVEGEPKWALKWERACDTSGRALMYTIGVLFLPVSRGSPILRLINLPFEQAIKYHRWIGYFTVVLSFVHGSTYAVYTGATHKMELLIEWQYEDICNFAGVIALAAALLMGITSLPYFRSRHFNTFFNVHQLYLAFYVFYVFHVGWNHVGESMGPIFIFFIDRFLRLMQSRRQVTGLSARVLPSGLVELKIPKQPGFQYNTLSFLYLNFPGLSRLEWHPFSNSSSPLNDDNEISVHIKPLGDWTTALHNEVTANSGNTARCPFALELYAEGPYGQERDYFLRYRNLILVAGGAGVTPFMAIIADILKRLSYHQEGLPTNVQLIWCVRGSAELDTLRAIKPGQINPGYGYQQSKSLRLTVRAYVTKEASTGGKIAVPMVKLPRGEIREIDIHDNQQKRASHGISTINSYQNLWMIALILACSTGYVFMSALFFHYVTDPKLQPDEKEYNMTIESILHFVSLFVGIFICGGIVVVLWVSSAKPPVVLAGDRQESEISDLEENDDTSLLDTCTVTEGRRPQFPELFNDFAEKHDGEEVGVLVCVPEGLQESVAEACRSQNFASLLKTPFHYHSVSFDL